MSAERPPPPHRRAVLRATVGVFAALPFALSACGSETSGDGEAPDAEPLDQGAPPLDTGAPDAAVPDAAEPDAAPPGPVGIVALPVDETRFPLGVQAGSATFEAALLWTFAAEPGAYAVHLWRDEAPEAVDTLEVEVPPETAGYTRVEALALEADTVYRYAFTSGDAEARVRSPLGRFVTAPAAGTRRVVRLGATTCTSFNRAPYRTLELMAAESLDFFCHLGDMSYNDGAETLEEFRAKWVRTLSEGGYRAILSSTGTYITWDDHEITDGSRLYDAPAEQIEAGRQAYFEALPIPRREGDRFWASYRWGDTVEVFVLDCRSERVPESRLTPEAQYISPAQFEWFTSALKASPCRFKLVMNSVPILALPPLWIFEDDRWAGYPAQRRALLDFIDREGIEDVFFIAGDFHVGAVARLDRSGADARMYEVLVGPGASNGNPLQLIADNDPSQREQIYPSDQFEYASGRHAATTLELDPDAGTVRVRFVGLTPDGAPEVLHDTVLRWGA
ncbi:MAG: alkaline phosphatase D family protein [Bradymonadia bacterium]